MWTTASTPRRSRRSSKLQNRVTDPSSALYAAVEDLLSQAQSAQSDSEFAADFERAQEYLANSQYDQCAAMLDTLDADDTLTDDQKQQVADLREELTKAQESAQRQEENQQRSPSRSSRSRSVLTRSSRPTWKSRPPPPRRMSSR